MTRSDADEDRLDSMCRRLAELGVTLFEPRTSGPALDADEYPRLIVDLLSPDVRGRIVEYVKSDLVKIEPAKLPGHFRSLQPF